jgi:hypothetical protein
MQLHDTAQASCTSHGIAPGVMSPSSRGVLACEPTATLQKKPNESEAYHSRSRIDMGHSGEDANVGHVENHYDGWLQMQWSKKMKDLTWKIMSAERSCEEEGLTYGSDKQSLITARDYIRKRLTEVDEDSSGTLREVLESAANDIEENIEKL